APGTYLVKYSSAIGRLVSNGQPEVMGAASHQQRKIWKFVGVSALIRYWQDRLEGRRFCRRRRPHLALPV
ncbi:MAG TPA: hypothetical protein VF798_05865, partial [Burkholderiaceae bacterium]